MTQQDILAPLPNDGFTEGQGRAGQRQSSVMEEESSVLRDAPAGPAEDEPVSALQGAAWDRVAAVADEASSGDEDGTLLLENSFHTVSQGKPGRFMAFCGRRGLIALSAASALFTAVVVSLIVLNGRQGGKAAFVIAFGSCTAYDAEKQAIWTEGVVPLAPDAWIWLGDLVYLDDPSVDCRLLPDSPQCDCESDWLLTSPYSCFAGDIGHARDRWQAYLGNPDYLAFLDYMCPGSFAAGFFPPPGTDSSVCPRPILGIYDDHDFGWNNGNHREPQKESFKTMFLDAIGEAPDSPRRNALRGAWGTHTLDANGVAVDVFLLDERYNREELPCWTRKEFCDAVLGSGPGHGDFRWCTDFLVNGSAVTGEGSCCGKDEAIFRGWCRADSSRRHPLFGEACDPSHARFGTRMLVLDDAGGIRPPDASDPVDLYQASPFCDMLGRTQRLWFREALAASSAPLKLIASGSVAIGNPQWQRRTVDGEEVRAWCSGDNWDCYGAAQQDFFHTVASASGCVIVLTGDHHWTDIRVLDPANDAATYDVKSHGTILPDTGLVQVMSSGLTESTSPNRTCQEFLDLGFTRDPHHLRQGGECNVVTGGSFASLHVQSRGGALQSVTIVMRDRRANEVYSQKLDVAKCRAV